MKKLFWPLLAVLFLAACTSTEPREVTISGQVENATTTTVEVFYYKEFLTNSMEKVEVQLDQNNSFQAVLPVSEGQFVYLRIAPRNLMLYLNPGAELNITLDAADFNAIPQVTGTGSLESAFMLAYAVEVESKYGRMAVLNRSAELSADEFLQFLQDVHLEKSSYLQNFQGDQPLDAGFIAKMETNFLYEKYGMMLEYPRAYAHFNPGAGPLELPEGYYDFLDDGNLFKDEYVSSRPYISFLGNYLNYYGQKNAPENDARSYYQVQYDLANELFTGKSRDLLISQAMISMLNFGDFKAAQETYTHYSSTVNTPEYKDLVAQEYQNVLVLSPGQPAPDFTLTDINGEQVSLSDFAGKVVYLDFWASWCGPCMREMPHAKELKKRFADQDDLIYLYVSVDTDEAAWRKTVADHDITGVHVNVPGFAHEVPAAYNLKGVPTFYLIDREGNIFDNRPPRPSNQLIDETLITLLDK